MLDSVKSIVLSRKMCPIMVLKVTRLSWGAQPQKKVLSLEENFPENPENFALFFSHLD